MMETMLEFYLERFVSWEACLGSIGLVGDGKWVFLCVLGWHWAGLGGKWMLWGVIVLVFGWYCSGLDGK